MTTKALLTALLVTLSLAAPSPNAVTIQASNAQAVSNSTSDLATSHLAKRGLVHIATTAAINLGTKFYRAKIESCVKAHGDKAGIPNCFSLLNGSSSKAKYGTLIENAFTKLNVDYKATILLGDGIMMWYNNAPLLGGNGAKGNKNFGKFLQDSKLIGKLGIKYEVCRRAGGKIGALEIVHWNGLWSCANVADLEAIHAKKLKGLNFVPVTTGARRRLESSNRNANCALIIQWTAGVICLGAVILAFLGAEIVVVPAIALATFLESAVAVGVTGGVPAAAAATVTFGQITTFFGSVFGAIYTGSSTICKVIGFK